MRLPLPGGLFRNIVGLSFALGLGRDVIAATADAAAQPLVTAAVPVSAGDPIENSVVKIFSTIRSPDLVKPWSKQSPNEITGTGIVIEGKRILTNAHVVLYATQVNIQASQSGEKLAATVEAIAPGIDLAVLRLEDETFFDSHVALARANLQSQPKDPVLVYGFPTGGSSLSITKGIVSRIEFAAYKYPVSGLRLQIDAAINPGNSGGPAIVNDKVIGLAFSHLSNAQNIGYIIPTEEIDLFLGDVSDGHYDGKPALYDEFQSLENPALREYLKVDKTVHGVVVRTPYLTNNAYPLRAWDIVTEIGGKKIDDQGMIRTGENLRLRFLYQVQKAAKDRHVPLTIWRGGQAMALSVPVSNDRPKLISTLEGTYPSYFIYGPLVLTSATENIVSGMTSNPKNGTLLTTMLSQRNSPLLTRRGDQPAFEGEELVMVAAPFLPHKLAKGYANPAGRVIRSINGIAVKNLVHLVGVLRSSKEKFTVIEFAEVGAEALVLPHEECLAATDGLLSDNGIRAQGSADALAVWSGAATSTAAAP